MGISDTRNLTFLSLLFPPQAPVSAQKLPGSLEQVGVWSKL